MMGIYDIVLTITHVTIIGFNLIGWYWKKTRQLHRWFLGLTLFSWLILGFKCGWGYCFLTDWHWDLKRRLGESDLPGSFVHYLFNQVSVQWDPWVTDLITVLGLVFALIMTSYQYWHRQS